MKLKVFLFLHTLVLEVSTREEIDTLIKSLAVVKLKLAESQIEKKESIASMERLNTHINVYKENEKLIVEQNSLLSLQIRNGRNGYDDLKIQYFQRDNVISSLCHSINQLEDRVQSSENLHLDTYNNANSKAKIVMDEYNKSILEKDDIISSLKIEVEKMPELELAKIRNAGK